MRTHRLTLRMRAISIVVADRIAFCALAIVFVLVAANIAFDVVLHAPVGTGSVPLQSDVFADYFKFVLALPGGDAADASDLFGLREPIERYRIEGLHSVLRGMATTPVTTLFCLVNARAMRFVDPAILFVGLNVALLVYWGAIVARVAQTRGALFAWIGIGMISYPTLMVLVRGNVYAGFTSLLLVHALLLSVQGRAPRLASILLATAIAIRPNAAVLVLPLLLLGVGGWWMLVRLGVVGGGMSIAALVAAHALLPHYSLDTFLAGLREYHQAYVTDGFGLRYGSSLYGGLKLLFGQRAGLEVLAELAALAILLAAYWLGATRRVRGSTLIFLTCAAYCLGSTVIGDYHLFAFAAVPLALAVEAQRGDAPERTGWTLLIVACLILAPKNYVFSGDVSWQVAANPLLLLATSIIVIALCARRAVARGDRPDHWFATLLRPLLPAPARTLAR